MTARELLAEGEEVLVRAGLARSEARREALLALAHLLRLSPPEVFLHRGEVPAEEFREILRRRAEGVPLAYVLGEVEFYGHRFLVAPGVLIPRPETEILVEAALEALGRRGATVLELGVGSGCVALTLALEGGHRVLGVEISPEALAVARRNRALHRLEDRVHLVRGDWLSPVRPGPRFDAVVSNPPYISPGEWPSLDPEVREHEPSVALLAPEDGLFFLRLTLDLAPLHLRPGGVVLLELGHTQREAVARLAAERGFVFSFVRDLLGHDRVLVARPGQSRPRV